MGRKALVVWGGWDLHEPEKVGQLFARVLREEGFEAELCDTLEVFRDEGKMRGLSLIVPVWTMGKIDGEQERKVCAAVATGVGLAGCHGGMCDAFREATEWQFMTGGQWVAHPGNEIPYVVRITGEESPITRGIEDFEVNTEQYYMHVDPAIKVLATTRFPLAEGPHVGNGPVEMPVVWTKMYGKGRVYYNALGHNAAVLEKEQVLTLMRRGFLWAAK
jgi:type 1 glutamine amidotransferase